MILKAEKIAELLKANKEGMSDDPLSITPCPDLNALHKSGAASLDLRLGTWFATLRQAKLSHLKPGHGAPEAQLTKSIYVPFGSAYYLHPRSFVLGVTLEWLRLPRNLAAYVIGRSSWGRRGLVIATATGVHPGFQGCLTLELSNLGEIPIEISPGMEICQLFFHKVEVSETRYVDSSKFVGKRKPILGKVTHDEIALTLARAYRKS